MKQKDKEKLNQLNKAGLLKELEKEISELTPIVVDKRLGKLKDVKMVAKNRDKIAFIKTRIREREL
ncbi:hypothetical protein COT63_00035 [Candidatus Shapirobacteria bacterium CG09_land_8_20_14_0_10_38_17]|uniref:50S ribosomal protein L29 n=1 Tax=Candidatus Shapirobacteria bacterium CG09_land_8_20_14_0_10_38_17 TaxID=1974884 RepID=A0A2H0WTY6_9BACT|nr:MAG: hypothetical protein COT63_00035 [Candidatus Shapirobacteria bacterium CG09_land_8_20_14_0_10_38_17]